MSSKLMVDGYPSNWNTLRQKTYERDDYTCQNCGALGGTQGHVEVHAHHIVPKSKGGGHDLSNLTTLCKDCHNAVHGGESVQRHSTSRGQGVDEILRFPELAQAMERANGSAFIQKAGICISETSNKFIEYIINFFSSNSPVFDLSELTENTIATDSVEWSISRDNQGYTWVVIDCDDYNDLLGAIYDLVTELSGEGPHRPLAVLFPFNLYFGEPDVLYWIYSQRQKSFYPFAPLLSENNERDQTVEFQATNAAEETVYIEPDEQEWYPMWPSQRTFHPWELPIQSEILNN